MKKPFKKTKKFKKDKSLRDKRPKESPLIIATFKK
jgi:hypothetical protein